MTNQLSPRYAVEAARLVRFCEGCFAAVGVSERDASTAASLLVRADLRGIRTHGVRQLPGYIRRLRAGGINSQANIRITAQTETTISIDGDAGLGQVIAARAVELGMRRALEHNVAFVTVRNSNHFGASGLYALMCAENGFIGIVYTNAPPSMAVTGSRGRVLGNGAIAYGVPCRGTPVVFDASMSAVSSGVITMAGERGQPIQSGWIIDSAGLPSIDPNDLDRGALLPAADHKGYGLALLGEMLGGVLAGAALSPEIGWPIAVDKPWRIGHAFVILRVDSIMPLADFEARAHTLATYIRDAPAFPGVQIRLPGESAANEEARCLREGIDLDGILWASLTETATELGTYGLLSDALISPSD